MRNSKKFTGQVVAAEENGNSPSDPVSGRAGVDVSAPQDKTEKTDKTDSSTPAPELPESGEKLSQEDFDRLQADRDQLFDRLARLQAEFENVRKREARERADFRDFAVGNAVEQFLPVLDNFRLALGSSASPEQLRMGVDLIVKQMEEALRSLNVQAVETTGTAFDPRVHEALEKVERDDLPDNQVLDEVRRGYRIRERLLRPALVRVVSNPRQRDV